MKSFFEIITEAVADIERYGFDSEERVSRWVQQIVFAIRERQQPLTAINEQIRRAFESKYQSVTNKSKLIKYQPEIKRYTIDMIQPKLHAELQRRILTASNLIRLNRNEMIERTLRRFEGWATSVPPGGSSVTDTNEVKSNISKALKQLPFEERRVMIDQGHKLISNINDIVAVENGAIAGKWRSHWKQPGYDYRKDHKARDGKVYAIRGNWAISQHLMNKGDGYTDEMTAPGEEVFCRCDLIYIYTLSKLPDSMLTEKGKTKLKLVKEVIKNAI